MGKTILYKVWKSSFKGLPKKEVSNGFKAIKLHYEETHRHYHNLMHVEDLIQHINGLELIQRDRLILIYSAFYHDVIYNARSNSNEKESAEFAKIWLKRLKVDASIIDAVERTILATVNHESENDLTRLFLDMDMSILAASQDEYITYITAIQRENNRFPYFMYQIGRKRFIQSTLKRSRIFLTDLYFSRYEVIARTNLHRELNTLSI